jgi:RNA polymerase sigma factor (sigma-70 family)
MLAPASIPLWRQGHKISDARLLIVIRNVFKVPAQPKAGRGAPSARFQSGTKLKHDKAKLDVYMAHRSALVDYATPIVGDRMRAEDVVQDSYLRFAGRESEEGGLRQPLAYLYRIVRNTALDCVRRLSAESRRDEAQAVMTGTEPLAPSPEEEALGRDHLRLVEAALAELPDRSRKAFELQRFEGLTSQEIGARLGVSSATAHRLARTAMVHVMRRLHEGDAS